MLKNFWRTPIIGDQVKRFQSTQTDFSHFQHHVAILVWKQRHFLLYFFTLHIYQYFLINIYSFGKILIKRITNQR
jgi:hypothetical protein